MVMLQARGAERARSGLEHRIRGINVPMHPSTIRLIAYWQACEARGGLRMGRDVPASGIAPLLPDLVVAEPVRDWADAHIRLAGSAMAEYFGRDLDGARMSEIFAGEPRDGEMLLAGARAAIARNRPGIVEQILVGNGREILRQEVAELPIYAPDRNVRWILTSTFSF
ncbi:MAG: PAS domain-containing protein [Proteobacteria bacterium]|nr:PAS domain-containing protein [Pseudomonadota bacterium]